MINRVYKFNTELLEVKTGEIRLLPRKEYEWLLSALEEEITEFSEAQFADDIAGCIDSVLDLAYFAIGACVRMGLTSEQIEQCFDAIHEANMKKKMGVKATRPQDGSIADAIKPDGWIAPEDAISAILGLKD